MRVRRLPRRRVLTPRADRGEAARRSEDREERTVNVTGKIDWVETGNGLKAVDADARIVFEYRAFSCNGAGEYDGSWQGSGMETLHGAETIAVTHTGSEGIPGLGADAEPMFERTGDDLWTWIGERGRGVAVERCYIAYAGGVSLGRLSDDPEKAQEAALEVLDRAAR